MKGKRFPRRTFIKDTSMTAAGLLVLGSGLTACAGEKENEETEDEVMAEGVLKISLAQWSLNKPIFAGEIDNLGFAEHAKGLGFEAIEYVNQFFKDKAEDKAYLDQLNQRASDAGVVQLLIMIDGEGPLGSPDDDERTTAVENHYKWVQAAKHLGCHSIRVNAAGSGSASDVQTAAVDGLGRLAEYATDYDINVLVENHGGYSSHGQWLAGIMKQVDMENCGTLPDFGNFCLKSGENGCEEEYDRYQGMRELMPFAKAVSAKSNDFKENGSEVNIVYGQMIDIIREAGYSGYIGVEYEGNRLSHDEGILATKELLERYI